MGVSLRGTTSNKPGIRHFLVFPSAKFVGSIDHMSQDHATALIICLIDL